ncbi:RNI-like protein, partial [Rhodotorula sp. JG-1b]
PVGSFAVCAECGKKFTVSKYTASNPNAEVGGVLCQPCTSDGASTPNKRPKVQKKKSQRGVDETLFTPIPTLQQACLALVSQYIHSVEALGDLGPKNLDKVSKIVAKNRALDDLNLKLFLDVGHREIKLYDCTKITDRALASISTFAPHLTHLTLLQCGRLDDDVLTAWSHPLTGFKELRHLTLYAPYLVRAEKWKEFFEGIGGADEQGEEEGVVTKKRPEVETFQLRMSSRFNDEALAAFVKHNPHVVHLQLSELGKLTSSSLSLLHPLARSSTTIAPSSSSSSSDSDLIALLATGLGAGLERLVLDGNALLTERSLTEGVRRYCHRLRELSLSDYLPLFEPGRPWRSPGLTLLNLHRLTTVNPPTLSALMAHSAHSLEYLNLHSCDELDANSLMDTLAQRAKKVQVLDLSFVRAVDNFVVQRLLDKCGGLRVLFLHGNNRVTSDVPRKRGVHLRGLENA